MYGRFPMNGNEYGPGGRFLVCWVDVVLVIIVWMMINMANRGASSKKKKCSENIVLLCVYEIINYVL